VGLGIYTTQDPRAGFYAFAYVMFACWLIWYPELISRMQFSRRFRLHMRIPPVYIQKLGWTVLLAPGVILVLGPAILAAVQLTARARH